jgi:4-amino-4-deoxy-L-arabinose transferase-like glycosyltransferase
VPALHSIQNGETRFLFPLNPEEPGDSIMKILRAANLALSFLLELCMLAAFAYWGFTIGAGLFAQLLLGIGVPVIIIVIWGIFLAPASTRRLQGWSHWLLEIVIFVLAIVALYTAGQSTLTMIFAAVYTVNVILRLVWKQ